MNRQLRCGIDVRRVRARARYRLLLLRGHAWLARHPRLQAGLQAAGSLKGRPETIARGVAIGLFIGLTPTVGVQTVLMIGICLLLSGNFPVAFAASFVSNPLTMGPLYWSYHEIGQEVAMVLPPFAAELEAGHLLGIGDEILITGIGSLLIATPVAAASYLFAHYVLATIALRRYQRQDARRPD